MVASCLVYVHVNLGYLALKTESMFWGLVALPPVISILFYNQATISELKNSRLCENYPTDLHEPHSGNRLQSDPQPWVKYKTI